MADNYQCFYCDDSLTENGLRRINFFHNELEREETLCVDCYSEWLHGIKE
ncbi:hypothetical protein GH741_14815 [Aquibacillus halophilus]|uniref:Uncharacterized protein n=1 Tax=Aquibacillus halophilus TaxID=930132 RepID=A0A6A8DRS1_9BACI|nr:hypothetical protein [Aquibacillus halophilus]MRH43912.1 hypothetical protein [Aquibacillus halophilus]